VAARTAASASVRSRSRKIAATNTPVVFPPAWRATARNSTRPAGVWIRPRSGPRTAPQRATRSGSWSSRNGTTWALRRNGSESTKVIRASLDDGTLRSRNTVKIRSTSEPNGLPVAGSTPSAASRRSSPDSWTSSASMRWSRRASSTWRVTSTDARVATTSRRTNQPSTRTRRLGGGSRPSQARSRARAGPAGSPEGSSVVAAAVVVAVVVVPVVATPDGGRRG
jgi:hypothetical protein